MSNIALNTKQILSINNRQSGVIMRNLISEYKDLINEIKYYISSEWVKKEAIDFVLFDEFNFMFNTDKTKQKRELLKEWCLTKMH